MCGIAGIVSKKLSEVSLVRKMVESVRHRGPDDEGYLFIDTDEGKYEQRRGDDTVAELSLLQHVNEPLNERFNLAFGFRRLSIIDLTSSGHQPMTYADGVLWIVFNGEIYNYVELRRELIADGYEFRTATDTEIILAAYLKWGAECVKRFNGMWAFVIYDSRSNVLFGSRDRFGVKPLYYTMRDNKFAFASEIKALLTLRFVERRVNEKALFNYLLMGFVEQGEETFFRDIRKVPHGHYFIYDIARNSLRFERYYKLEYSEDAGTFSRLKVQSYVCDIRDLLFEAVRLRLRSDVPVGSCLSGGIDSSAIVSIINELLRRETMLQLGDKQRVFTACYPRESIDESRFAQKVVEKTETEWHQVRPRANELWSDIRDLVYYQEEPFSSTSTYAQYRVMKLVREAGVRVVLDGQGGDELFTGYLGYYGVFFSSLLVRIRLGTLISEIISLGNAPVTSKMALADSLKFLALRFMSDGVMGATVLRLKSDIIPWANRNFFETYRAGIAASYRERWQSKNLNQYMAHVIENFGLQELLKYEDRNSMRFSVEARTPFADDVNLIDYVFKIPWIYKIHDGWSKYLLRESVADLLPSEILTRKSKIGFATPESKWVSDLSGRFIELMDRKDDHINTAHLRECLLNQRSLRAGTCDIWRFLNVIMWKLAFNCN